MPNQALYNEGQQPGAEPQRKKAISNPGDVFNQFAGGGNVIPLYKTLASVGITRPEEQQLFFNYARQHGGYDAATGDFVIPKEKAMQLWDTMRNDRQFQLQLNQARVRGIDEGVNNVANVLRNPRTAQQMLPEEHEALAQKIDSLRQMRNALMQNINTLMGGEQPKIGKAGAATMINNGTGLKDMMQQRRKALEPRSANDETVQGAPKLTDFL